MDEKRVAQEQDLNANRVLDIDLTVNVNLGRLTMTLHELLKIVPGAILELDKKVEDPLELTVNSEKVVAKGEVVTIGENLGLRVIEDK